MNAPEAYIQFTPGLITDDGEVTNETTAEFLRNHMAEFRAFIVRVYTVLPRRREGYLAANMSNVANAKQVRLARQTPSYWRVTLTTRR
jgi:pheromone shutdown protein TraB